MIFSLFAACDAGEYRVWRLRQKQDQVLVESSFGMPSRVFTQPGP
jgi:hypothetical protein